MSCLYSELKKSFIKHQDRFVFDQRLIYGQLLNEVEEINFNLSPSSVFQAELTSGEFFIKTLLAALRQKLVFCPIAKDSGDFNSAL